MMSDYDEGLILAKRNISALTEGLKHFEQMRQADAQRVEALMSTVTQQTQQIQALQNQVAILRAITAGHGATS